MFVFQESANTGTTQITQSSTADVSTFVSGVLEQGFESKRSDIATFADGIATIDAAGTPFSEVTIGGQSYEAVEDPNNLAPGQYHYDAIADRVTVRQVNNVPREKVFLRGPIREEGTLNVLLPDPDFIKLWNFKDNLKISRKINQHPTLTARFTIPRSLIESIRTQLPNGQLVNMYGMPLRIKQVNFTATSEDETSLFACDVQMQGQYAPFNNPSRNELDQVVKLKGDDCDNPLLGWQNYSVYENLVEDKPPKYFGKPIEIFVGQKVSSEATTTLRKLLTERVIINRQFLVWSDPKGIVAKDWGKTQLHTHNPPGGYEHQQSRTFTGAGYREPITKVQLTDEYRNTEIKLQNPEELEEQEKPKVTVRWEYENDDSLLGCQTPSQPDQVGQSVFIIKTPKVDVFRTPNQAFDTGGFTKTAHKIFEENGVEVARISRKYGWVHTSLDTYSVVGKKAVINGDSDYGQEIQVGDFYKIIFTPYAKFSFVGSAWVEVESTTTYRYYDDQGYLYKEVTSGKRLWRLSEDNEQLEAITTQFQALELKAATEDAISKTDDADLLVELQKSLDRANALLALAESYRFKQTEPIDKMITYHVGALSEYFSDITIPSEACQWVSPKFLLRSVSREFKNETFPNPGSTDDFPLPPIVKGRWFTEILTNTVTESRAPGRYVTRRYVNTQEGQGLSRTFKLLGSVEHIGRPSQHQHKEVIEAPPPKQFGGAAVSGNGVNNAFKTQNTFGASEINKEYKFLLNSPQSNPVGNITENTVSWPDVYDSDLAEKIAETQLSIDNTTKAEILTFKSLYDPKYIEGDRIVFEGRIYVILSIDYSVSIDESLRRIEDFTVQCGRLIQVPVAVEKVQNNPVDVKSVSISSGLYAVDGKAIEYRSVFNQLPPGTIANAIGLGVIDDLLEAANLKTVSEANFEESDGIESFLNGGIGGTSSGGLGSGIAGFTQPEFEDGEQIDLRTKTPLEKFAELTNYTAALNSISSKFQEKIAELMRALLEQGQDPSGGRTDLSGGSGSGGDGDPPPTPPGSLFQGPAPNITLTGGDNLLEDLLTTLFNSLNSLLELLALAEDESGGAGGAAGGAGGGQGGSGGDGSLGNDPVIQTGTLVYNYEAPDLGQFLQLLLDMIAEARRLAEIFDLTLEEALQRLLNGKSAGPPSGGAAGGAGGGFGGSGAPVIPAQPKIFINFIVPEIPPLAEIVINTPEADISNFDMELLTAALDELFALIDPLAEDLEIDFDSEDFLLEDGAAIVQPSSPATGANPQFADDVKSDIQNDNVPLGLATGDAGVIYKDILVEIADISGVVSVPWQLPEWAKIEPLSGTTAGGGGSGSATGGTGGAQGLLSGSSGGLSPSKDPAVPGGSTGGLTDTSGGLTGDGTQPITEGGQPAGGDNYAGNPGDFNYDGQQTPNNGYGDDAAFIPGTNLTITPVVAVPDSSVELPLTIKEQILTGTGSVVAPDNIVHDPNFDGAIAYLGGAVATGLVIWEFADEEAPVGVVLETPYDIDLTLRFLPEFVGGGVNLKISLRSNPDIFDFVSISTDYISQLTGGQQYGAGVNDFSDVWRVDPGTFTVAPPSGGSSGINVSTQVEFTWVEPNPGATPESYLVFQQQPSGSFSQIASITEPTFTFDVGETYRIDGVYREPFLAIAGNPFLVESAPITARDEADSNVSGFASATPIVPPSTEPANFYIALSNVDEVDQLVAEGKQAGFVDAGFIAPPSVAPLNFFAIQSNVDEVDQLVAEGKQAGFVDAGFISPPSTEPPNFYELL